MKPKTVRRLLLLGIVGVLLLGSALGVVVVRRWQAERLQTRLRAEGIAAYEQQDNAVTLDRLGRYLKRQGDRPEPEVLLLYARARARLEESDGRHLKESIGAYRRYLAERPEDDEAHLELVKLYSLAGLAPEARDAASRLRPPNLELATRDDLPALREEVRAMVAMGSGDPRLAEVARRIADLAPLDLDAHLTYCDALVRQGRRDDARTAAEDVLREHPSDPRARLVALLVSLGPPAPEEVDRLFAGICTLVGLDPENPAADPTGELPDEPYVLRVASALDQSGKHDHARAVLNAAAHREDMPVVFRLAVRRAWQAGLSGQVVQLTDAMEVASPAAPPDVLGFRALALLQLERPDDAIRESLARRPAEFRARAWAGTLAAVATQPPDPRAAAEALSNAVQQHPQEPVFHFLRAECLAELGRLEDAIASWRLATESPLAIGWVQPLVRMSQAELHLGLVPEAVDHAGRARGMAPGSLAAAEAYYAALVAQVERASAPTGQESNLLEFAEGIDIRLSTAGDPALAARVREQLLPGRVLILARAGRHAEARALIDEAIRATPPPGRPTLERLARVSIREGLGREEAALDAAVRLHGDAPSTASVRAEMLHARGRSAEALDLLQQAADAAQADSRVQWQMARAAFMDQIGDPAAAAAWISVADAHPDDLGVQSAALRSPSATRDAKFIERASERLTALTGGDGSGSSLVRLAKARALLTGPLDVHKRDQAIALIREVTVAQPRLIEARTLLANALLAEDEAAGVRADLRGALAELRAAAEDSLDPAPLRLLIASVLQRQLDFAAARRELVDLVQDYPLDRETHRRAAEMLIAQGAPADAIPILEGLAGSEQPAVMLAEAFALARRDSDALAAFRRIAEHPPESPADALSTAIWLRRLGDPDAAVRVMTSLDDLAIAPDQRDLYRGRYAAAFGDRPAAIAAYRSAIAANPRNADAHLALVATLAEQGEPAARGALRKARAALPEDQRFIVLERQWSAMAEPGADSLRALADALGSDPAQAASADSVRALAAAIESGEFNSEQGLVAFADRQTGNLPIQNVVIRRLMELSPPRTASAARVAERAMASFPIAPEPARLAAAVHARAGRWDRMLVCAQAWQTRDPSRPAAADAAVAEAHIRLRSPERALEVLRPRLEQARLEPTSPDAIAIVGAAARAMVALKQLEPAYAALAPVLPLSASLRNEVLVPLILNEIEAPEAARFWLDRARPAFERAGSQDRALLALAYATLAMRSESLREPLLASAESLLGTLESAEQEAHAAVLEARGAVFEARGAAPEAVEQYRLALRADPAGINALSRLAGLLEQITPDPGVAETLRVAEEAVGRSQEPGVMIALARLHQAAATAAGPSEASASLQRALALYRAVLEGDPARVEALIRAAAVADALNERAGAIEYYTRALAIPTVPPDVKAVCQNNAAYLLLNLNRSSDDIRRARVLAESAVAVGRRASFLDTLARVELASGNDAKAEALFREAITADPVHVDARLGLAGALIRRDRAGREEATRLLAAIEADSGSGSAVLSDLQRKTLAELQTQAKNR